MRLIVTPYHDPDPHKRLDRLVVDLNKQLRDLSNALETKDATIADLQQQITTLAKVTR